MSSYIIWGIIRDHQIVSYSHIWVRDDMKVQPLGIHEPSSVAQDPIGIGESIGYASVQIRHLGRLAG